MMLSSKQLATIALSVLTPALIDYKLVANTKTSLWHFLTQCHETWLTDYDTLS